MSGFREVLDLVELCEEQGFRVEKLKKGANGWKVFPKTRAEIPVCLYGTNSAGGSQTRYLNQRSQLKRIGVVFPELENRKHKEPTVAANDKPTTIHVHRQPGPAPGSIEAQHATTLEVAKARPDLAASQARLARALEDLELAVHEVREASAECQAAAGPVLAMFDLVKQIRG